MGLIDSAKAIGELVKKVHEADLKIEMQGQVIALQGEIMEIQQELSISRNENETLHGRLKVIEKHEVLKARLQRRHNHYVDPNDNPTRPYCIGCFDNHGKTVTLTKMPSGRGDCPVCKSSFLGVFD